MRLRKKVLLMALSALFAVGVLEVGLHLLDPLQFALVRERDELGRTLFAPGTLELIPGVRTTYLGHEVAIGAHGMRTPDFDQVKPDDVFRVVVLGDSVAFGWGIAERDTLARVVERELNAGGVPGGRARAEVINAAVPGWGLGKQLLCLRDRIMDLSPDLLVFVLITNDLHLPMTETYRQPFRFVPEWAKGVYVLSMLERAIDNALPGPVHEDYRARLPTSDPELLAQAQERACTWFTEWKKVVGQVPLLVVDTIGFEGGSRLEDLAGCVTDLGFGRIDAFFTPDDYRDYMREFAVSPVDAHPNARGHRILAGWVLDWIRGELK